MAEGDIIKSALEIAMEKVASLGEATEEERLQWKYTPEGEKLAGRFLNNDNGRAKEIAALDETARRYVTEAASAVFIKSIDLPRTEAASRRTQRALDGLKLVKKDQAGLQALVQPVDGRDPRVDEVRRVPRPEEPLAPEVHVAAVLVPADAGPAGRTATAGSARATPPREPANPRESRGRLAPALRRPAGGQPTPPTRAPPRSPPWWSGPPRRGAGR